MSVSTQQSTLDVKDARSQTGVPDDYVTSEGGLLC